MAVDVRLNQLSLSMGGGKGIPCCISDSNGVTMLDLSLLATDYVAKDVTFAHGCAYLSKQ